MYGIGNISATLNDVLKPFDGLGKPTIKLEFEDNAALADFLKDSKKASRFSDYQDVTATETTSTTKNAKATSKIRNGILMPADDSLYLPPSAGPAPLPPSPTSPKSLPPYVEPTPTTPSTPIVSSTGKTPEIDHWTTINNRLSYAFVEVPDSMDGKMFFKWVEKKYPYPQYVVCSFIKEDKRSGRSYWSFFFQTRDKDLILKTVKRPNAIEERGGYIIVHNLSEIERIQDALEKDGNRSLLLVQPHFYVDEDREDRVKARLQQQQPKPSLPPQVKITTPEVEPHPEPTEPEVTAESVTDEEIEKSNVTPVEIDWKAFEDAFAKASNWASMDPERSARVYVGGYKQYYDQYVQQVPAQYLNAFNWFVKRYVSDLISKRSRTASAAVTGPGGITAKKADSLNRANDRFMSASVQFPHALLKYINKIRLREKRNAFVNSSIDDRYAQRISELKKEVNGLMYLKDTYEHIAKGGEIPEEVRRRYAWMSRAYGTSNLRESILKSLNYNLNLQKATFKDKLTREVSKGNVEIIDAIIDYLKPKGLFTNRAEIWQFPSFVRTRRESVERETQRVDDAAADDNALYRVEYDEQEDRVKIYFNGMPSDKIRTWLKQNGFRWSPKNKAWQRQITENARRVVRMFEGLVQDGTLGKPTIKLEFEDNGELMSLFDTDGISGFTVNDKPADIFNCPESALQTQGYKPTYRRLPDYSHLIDTADGRKTLKGYGFDRATLDELINACKHYPQVARLADYLKDTAGDPLQSAFNVWHWLHTNIRYAYDTPGEEEIRTPARVWADRESGVDCDCLAVMTACLLLNMGLNPKFEIVAFNDEPTFSHIYVNLDGAAIDRVLPVFLARPDHITKTQIMDIPVYQLSGIGGCDALSGVYSSTLAKLQQGTATGEDINDFRKTQVLVTLRGIDDAAYSLAALLMPHVVTIADDGTYYFDSTAMAQLATKLDHDLADLISSNADAGTISQWIAAAAKQIDGAASVTSNGGDDTIVVIINPKGATTRVIGQMVKSQTDTLTPLTQTATATDTAAQTYAQSATPAIMQTSAMPGVSPDGDTANEDSDSDNWWWIAGIAAAFGIGAAVASNKKKRR